MGVGHRDGEGGKGIRVMCFSSLQKKIFNCCFDFPDLSVNGQSHYTAKLILFAFVPDHNSPRSYGHLHRIVVCNSF